MFVRFEPHELESVVGLEIFFRVGQCVIHVVHAVVAAGDDARELRDRMIVRP